MGYFGFVFWATDVFFQALVENSKVAIQHYGEFCKSDLRIVANALLYQINGIFLFSDGESTPNALLAFGGCGFLTNAEYHTGNAI